MAAEVTGGAARGNFGRASALFLPRVRWLVGPVSIDDGDELPKRRRWPWLVGLLALVVGAGGLWLRGRQPEKPEAPERRLFRKQLPAVVVAKARGNGAAELAACVDAAKPWPGVATALGELDAAWGDADRLRAATKALNAAVREAGLAYWVDPQFPGKRPFLTTYEVLSRASWTGGEARTEVLHVRRLDTLNLELGLLGHAGGDQPAVLRDRMELSVMRRLQTVDDGDGWVKPNEVDETAARLWRETLAPLVGADGLAEAERRLDKREQLARDMERRLKGGRIHVARPERLVFGDDYFENLEPYTSTRRRGGPLLLASDLRALRFADEALDDSAGLEALKKVIDLEAEQVEAHEAHHALDRRELEVPRLLQSLVGEDDLRFGRMAERELRAFLGELRDARPPACLSVVALGPLARGARSQSTPHFFAAHALLATLGEVDGSRGLDEDTTAAVMKKLCALPDAELRKKADVAAVALYGAPLPAARRE